jgi:hypothetical protein
VQIVKSTSIGCPIAVVFALVSDARNDPRWCSKVLSVVQVEGDEPGPGARYRVLHKPVPLRPARQMDHSCIEWEPPNRVRWREDDGSDVILVTYELEDLGDRTKMTQRSDAELAAPRFLWPAMRMGVGHDVARQLRALRELLEESA